MSQQMDRELTTADMVAATEPRAMERPAPTAESNDTMVSTRPATPATSDVTDTDQTESLLADQESSDFRSRWDGIQTGFVDEPRRAVEQADSLVAEVMQRLAKLFADERGTLEGQWDRGEDVSTEDLRLALRRYRAFFDRLLSV